MNLPDIPCVPCCCCYDTCDQSSGSRRILRRILAIKELLLTLQQRGYIVGLEDAVSIIHSEEHWAFNLENPDRVPRLENACM